jgi:GWxTD domain-containing protein
MKQSSKISHFVGVVVLMVTLLSACSGGERVMSSVYDSMYQVDHAFDHSTFIRQDSKDSAKVYFSIHTDQLLTKRSGPTADFRVEALFELYIESKSDNVGDSLFYRYSKRYVATPNEEIVGSFKIPMVDTTVYEVGLRIVDGNSGRDSNKYFFLSNDSSDPRYLTTYLSGVPSEYCSCERGEDVIVDIYGWEAGDVELSIYDVETELAPPPFSISSSSVPNLQMLYTDTLSHDGIMVVTCPGRGAMDFRDFRNNRKVTLPVFRIGFPEVVSRDEMMSVLKYVTTSAEYKEMRQSEDSRKALEYFWLDCAGSRERAKVLIDNFYSRVEEANIHFTGLVEGWKTDRGLIHIIYGPPEQILRLSNSEVWLYGAERSENTLKMVFDKSNNHSLDRSLDYRQSWYLTVDSWRSGRTISQ